jgi:hypothetical protein
MNIPRPKTAILPDRACWRYRYLKLTLCMSGMTADG